MLSQLLSRVEVFISGRSISDNILLAQELFRNYHRLSGPARCALKFDIRKAFDTVDWGFLLDLLSLLQFPPTFINWIRECITTPMYSVKVNGSLAGFFKGARGLRQGDPLSPYLVVLAMEAFSMILNEETLLPNFKFHWKTEPCNIMHVCFADDIIMFCHGDLPSVSIIHSCIQSFSMFSGLIPNALKSLCFLANVPNDVKESIN